MLSLSIILMKTGQKTLQYTVLRDENKENNLADKVADKLFFLPDK